MCNDEYFDKDKSVKKEKLQKRFVLNLYLMKFFMQNQKLCKFVVYDEIDRAGDMGN